MSDLPFHSEEKSFHPLFYVGGLLVVLCIIVVTLLGPVVEVRPFLVLFGVVLLLFILNSLWLRVSVSPERVHARLGRILPIWWRNVRVGDIESVQVIDLGWRRWNGGAHFVRYKGKTTLMMLGGDPRAVCIERKRGHRVVISSERPELLVAAIERARKR